MTTYNIPYDLAVKLDLTDGLYDEDLKQITEYEIIEDVEIKFKSLNGWTIEAHFKFSINNRNYGLCVNYNTSSPYALYMCELEDYNERDSDSEEPETDTNNINNFNKKFIKWADEQKKELKFKPIDYNNFTMSN
jgi:hypothetical protein